MNTKAMRKGTVHDNSRVIPVYVHRGVIKSLLTSGICALLLLSQAVAGTVTGAVQNPSGGSVANGTFSFTLTQAAVISGTATLVNGPVNCFTDANGNVVNEPNPLVAPVVSQNLASGTLAAGTYYLRLTYADGTGQTFASPETVFTLTGTGTLIVTAPVKQPAGVTNYKVYIGTSSGAETLQGSVTVSPGSWGNYSQTSALVAGSALPVSNTTVCTLHFNDEMQPSFVCYDVGLTGPSGGANLPGWPQYWYLGGGSNGTVNVSVGTPQSTVCQGAGVVYPQAILTNPATNGLQSINGPLSLNGFSFTAGPITGTTINGLIENLTGTQSTTFGSHATTTTETIIPASPFPISSPFPQFDYLAAAVNGIDFQKEQQRANRNGVLDAVAGGVFVPSSQTATFGGFGMQQDGIAGYVHNESPQGDPVGVYGEATVSYNTVGVNQTWSANFWCGEGTGDTPMTQNGSCYGLEIDIQQLTNHLGGWAMDFNGAAPFGFGGLLFVQPGASGFWKPGIEFATGSTKSPDNSGNAAIYFQPIASGNNQPSQGELWQSTDSGGGTHFFASTLAANGNFLWSVPNVGIQMALTSGSDRTLEIRRLSTDFLAGGTAVGSCTGLGTGSCSLGSGATDTNWSVQFSPAGAPSASGLFTITFGAALGTNAGNCGAWISNAGNSWATNASGAIAATVVQNSTNGTASVTFAWNNNGTNLTAGNTYWINGWCVGR